MTLRHSLKSLHWLVLTSWQRNLIWNPKLTSTSLRESDHSYSFNEIKKKKKKKEKEKENFSHVALAEFLNNETNSLPK